MVEFVQTTSSIGKIQQELTISEHNFIKSLRYIPRWRCCATAHNRLWQMVDYWLVDWLRQWWWFPSISLEWPTHVCWAIPKPQFSSTIPTNMVLYNKGLILDHIAWCEMEMELWIRNMMMMMMMMWSLINRLLLIHNNRRSLINTSFLIHDDGDHWRWWSLMRRGEWENGEL